MELCLTGLWDELSAIQNLLYIHFWQQSNSIYFCLAFTRYSSFPWLLNYNHTATYHAKSNSSIPTNTYLSRKIFWLVWLMRRELYLCMAHLETEKITCLKIPPIFNIYNNIKIILRNIKCWVALVFGKHIWKQSTILSISFPVISKYVLHWKNRWEVGTKRQFMLYFITISRGGFRKIHTVIAIFPALTKLLFMSEQC